MEQTRPLSAQTRGPRLLGYATVALFFGGFGLWSSTAPLASAAVAPGVVSPDGSRKTVQHYEGGIVQRIHVREGDLVQAGQPLLTLEDVQARAEFAELGEKLIHLLTIEARLFAEQSGSDRIVLPAELQDADQNAVAIALSGQTDLLTSRLATRTGREAILRQRILQLDEETAGLHEVIAAEQDQLALLDQEIRGVKELVDKGLERMPRLLALQRAQAVVKAERAENRARIARNGQKVGETRLQLLSLRQEEREEISKELNEVRAELAALRSRLPARRDVLRRTVVTAPIAGTVMRVQVTTEQGVVRPGDPILDIVPAEARLVIDARVQPTDIDVVQAGQPAKVLLTAFGQRTLPQIHGKLLSVSADSLTDQQTGQAYFLAKVEVDADQLGAIDDGLVLSPGMPADVMIVTGERTVLDYLIRPFVESITKSFRET